MLTNKYAEGYPGKRYYGGCEFVDIVRAARDRPGEGAVRRRARQRPAALGRAGERGRLPRAATAGRHADGARARSRRPPDARDEDQRRPGRLYSIVAYRVDRETSLIDMDEVERLAREHRPKVIVAGWSAYPRFLDFERFREIADDVGAYLMVDMAHFAGLVATGLHPSPVPIRRRRHDHDPQDARRRARRGDPVPRGVREEDRLGRVPRAAGRAARARDRRQGGGAADRRLRRSSASGRAHARRRPGGRRRAARAGGGVNVLTGGTDVHLVLCDLRESELDGQQAEDRLHSVGITVNRNAVPFDPRPPAVSSGLRIGTPALATRGLQVEDFVEVGRIIAAALQPGTSRLGGPSSPSAPPRSPSATRCTRGWARRLWRRAQRRSGPIRSSSGSCSGSGSGSGGGLCTESVRISERRNEGRDTGRVSTPDPDSEQPRQSPKVGGEWSIWAAGGLPARRSPKLPIACQVWAPEGVVGRGDAEIARVAECQRGCAHREQLLLAGLTPDAIRHRLKTHGLRSLHRDVYLYGRPRLEPLALETAAILHFAGYAILSDGTAAWISELIDEPPAEISVTCVGRDRHSKPGLRVHRVAALDPADVACCQGLPVTSVARTVVDLAGGLRPIELEGVLALIARRGLASVAEIEAAIARAPYAKGVKLLRELLRAPGELSRTRSRYERRLLALIRDAGLPPTARQRQGRRARGRLPVVRAAVDRRVRRVRLPWRPAGVRARSRCATAGWPQLGHQVVRLTARSARPNAAGDGRRTRGDARDARRDRRVTARSRRRLPSYADAMRYSDAVFAFLVAMAVAAALTPVAARLARRVRRGRHAARARPGQKADAGARRTCDPRRRAGRGGDLAARRRSRSRTCRTRRPGVERRHGPHLGGASPAHA